MMRPEQKSEELIMTLDNKYNKPGDVVFNPFTGFHSTGNACMLLPEHRRCIIGNNEPDHGAQAIVQLLEVFVLQMLNDNSDITGAPDLVNAKRLFTQEVERVKVNNYRNYSSIPKGYQPVKVF